MTLRGRDALTRRIRRDEATPLRGAEATAVKSRLPSTFNRVTARADEAATFKADERVLAAPVKRVRAVRDQGRVVEREADVVDVRIDAPYLMAVYGVDPEDAATHAERFRAILAGYDAEAAP